MELISLKFSARLLYPTYAPENLRHKITLQQSSSQQQISL
jgi:hypothetical protein